MAYHFKHLYYKKHSFVNWDYKVLKNSKDKTQDYKEIL